VPNPFNADARIVFEHAIDERVEVDIYDVSGRRVRSLASKEFPAGRNDVMWDGRNDRGDPVAGGVYFVMVTGGQWRATGRALLLK
jgi:flagellar hook assembly protein FlgD